MHFDKNCLYLLKSKADRGGMRLEKDHVNEEHSRGGGGPSTQAGGLPLLAPSLMPFSTLVPKGGWLHGSVPLICIHSQHSLQSSGYEVLSQLTPYTISRSGTPASCIQLLAYPFQLAGKGL